MLKALLTRGFLPRELPPLFSSKTFGDVVGAAGLPSGFSSQKASWTQPAQHNLARPGGLRRRLAVPNPVNFYRLAAIFANNAAALAAEWSKSPFSKTTPDASCKGPRAIARDLSDRAPARASLRVGARYLLRADISQFYPSIYSHSIPWVLHRSRKPRPRSRTSVCLATLLTVRYRLHSTGKPKAFRLDQIPR